MFNDIKAVIFDVDGVIISTDEKHYISWKEVFKNIFNIDLELEDKDLIRGISRKDSLNKLLKKYGLLKKVNNKKIKKILEIKNNIYLKHLEEIKVGDEYPGFQKLINFLKTKNIKLIVGSSSKNGKLILEKLNIINCFDAIVDVTKIKNHKPAPDIYLKAKEMSGYKASECLVIEDAQSGIDSAKKVNIDVVAYNNSNQKLYNYDVMVKNYRELLNLFKYGKQK